MGLQDYLKSAKQVKKEKDTILLRLRDSFNAAEEKTIGEDGLVELASLDETSSRDALKK